MTDYPEDLDARRQHEIFRAIANTLVSFGVALLLIAGHLVAVAALGEAPLGL